MDEKYKKIIELSKNEGGKVFFVTKVKKSDSKNEQLIVFCENLIMIYDDEQSGKDDERIKWSDISGYEANGKQTIDIKIGKEKLTVKFQRKTSNSNAYDDDDDDEDDDNDEKNYDTLINLLKNRKLSGKGKNRFDDDDDSYSQSFEEAPLKSKHSVPKFSYSYSDDDNEKEESSSVNENKEKKKKKFREAPPLVKKHFKDFDSSEYSDSKSFDETVEKNKSENQQNNDSYSFSDGPNIKKSKDDQVKSSPIKRDVYISSSSDSEEERQAVKNKSNPTSNQNDESSYSEERPRLSSKMIKIKPSNKKDSWSSNYSNESNKLDDKKEQNDFSSSDKEKSRHNKSNSEQSTSEPQESPTEEQENKNAEKSGNISEHNDQDQYSSASSNTNSQKKPIKERSEPIIYDKKKPSASDSSDEELVLLEQKPLVRSKQDHYKLDMFNNNQNSANKFNILSDSSDGFALPVKPIKGKKPPEVTKQDIPHKDEDKEVNKFYFNMGSDNHSKSHEKEGKHPRNRKEHHKPKRRYNRAIKNEKNKKDLDKYDIPYTPPSWDEFPLNKVSKNHDNQILQNLEAEFTLSTVIRALKHENDNK